MSEYTVIWSPDLRALVAEVNANLANGWKCQGGIAYSEYDQHGESGGWAQAMVKESYSTGGMS